MTHLWLRTASARQTRWRSRSPRRWNMRSSKAAPPGPIRPTYQHRSSGGSPATTPGGNIPGTATTHRTPPTPSTLLRSRRPGKSHPSCPSSGVKARLCGMTRSPWQCILVKARLYGRADRRGRGPRSPPVWGNRAARHGDHLCFAAYPGRLSTASCAYALRCGAHEGSPLRQTGAALVIMCGRRPCSSQHPDQESLRTRGTDYLPGTVCAPLHGSPSDVLTIQHGTEEQASQLANRERRPNSCGGSP